MSPPACRKLAISFDTQPDAIAVVSNMALAVIATVLFGLPPILQSSNWCVVEALKNNTVTLDANNENFLPGRAESHAQIR